MNELPIHTSQRFIKKYGLNILLFILTVFSTFLVGALLSVTDEMLTDAAVSGDAGILSLLSQPNVASSGMLFSLAIISILLAHESGHYIACRIYGIEATLPYFIPFPSLIGTMGAFIRIKSPISSKKALFDIGAAGPISGFILTVPWLYIGIKLSEIKLASPGPNAIYFQDPLLTKIVIAIVGIDIPNGYELMAHPVYIAAWFGCLATAINLIPVGQLDGGHIVYATFRKNSGMIYKVAFGITLVIALVSFLEEGFSGWILWVFLTYFLMRKGHPPTLNDHQKLNPGRKILALVTLCILLLTFMPIPIKFA